MDCVFDPTLPGYSRKRMEEWAKLVLSGSSKDLLPSAVEKVEQAKTETVIIPCVFDPSLAGYSKKRMEKWAKVVTSDSLEDLSTAAEAVDKKIENPKNSKEIKKNLLLSRHSSEESVLYPKARLVQQVLKSHNLEEWSCLDRYLAYKNPRRHPK